MSTRHLLDAEGAVVCGATPSDDGSNVSSDHTLTTCEDCKPYALLKVAYTLLGTARYFGTDPGLARTFGRSKRLFMDAVIEKGLVN